MRSVRLGAAVALLALVAAGCALANPWPDVPPTTPDAHHVLLLGDSLMGGTATLLPGLMRDVTFYDEHRNGSGLVGQLDGVEPVDFFEAQLQEHPDVDTVVFEWAGACANPCPIGYGSLDFYAKWTSTMVALRDAAVAHGLAVLWVVPPPPPPEAAAADGPFVFTPDTSTTLSNLTRWFRDVTLVDWWSALSDTGGAYQQTLFYGLFDPPALHQVRADDRIHLSIDGAFRTSWWTMAALRGKWVAP